MGWRVLCVIAYFYYLSSHERDKMSIVSPNSKTVDIKRKYKMRRLGPPGQNWTRHREPPGRHREPEPKI